MTGRLWRIVAPHFVCGLVVADGRVVEAAPIVRWALGRRWSDVREAMKRKGWSGEPLGAERASRPARRSA